MTADDPMAVDETVTASKRLSALSLFTSFSTLICCALPALLVAIGAGAALSTLVSHVPQLVWVSEHKPEVFGLAGAMLLMAGYFQWRARHAPCPADPQLAAVCRQARRNAKWVYWISVAIYAVGAWFAFVAPLLL